MYKQAFRLLKRQPVGNLRDFSVAGVSLSRKILVFDGNKRPTVQLQLRTNDIDIFSRSYAKGRDRKKEKNKKVRFDEQILKEYFDMEKLFEDLKRPLEIFKDELMKHATLRTCTGAIEGVKVKFEGEEYSIQDLAEVGKKNAFVYILDFSSFPGAIPSALTALRKSNLNLNVQQEGCSIIVPIPKVNKEHRELLARKSKMYFVKCKDAIRGIQMKYIKSLGQLQKLPTQDKFKLTEQLTALGDQQIHVAEEMLKTKQEDLVLDEE